MKTKFLEETNAEFKEFVESLNQRDSGPSRSSKEKIFQMVHEDLNPNSWLIFSKISMIHFFVGMLTLAFCPQFGLKYFGEGTGLMSYFMGFGTYACMALCGGFFVGSSLLATGFILRVEELRVLRTHRILQVSSLVLLSLGAFTMARAEVILSFAAAWAFGSLVAGIAALEIGWYFKTHFR